MMGIRFIGGTDSDNGLPFPGNPDLGFYIGRIGGETTANLEYFDRAAATKATYTRTYTYWDLGGPGLVYNMSPVKWGRAQGEAFIKASQNLTWRHNNSILFLDVERGNGGWGRDKSSNIDVLNGAAHAISLGSYGYEVGIYCSPYMWDLLFGSYVPLWGFSLWLAGTPNNIEYNSIGEAQWKALPHVGGQQPTIWQYHVSGGVAPSNQDLDIALYDDIHVLENSGKISGRSDSVFSDQSILEKLDNLSSYLDSAQLDILEIKEDLLEWQKK